MENSLEGTVSKQIVKAKLHGLKFPKSPKGPEKKKKVEYLYLEAEEDHVSLHFHEWKSDLIGNSKGKKNNSLITKLVYTYEGIEPEVPQSKRYKLINPHYFSRICDGGDCKKVEDAADIVKSASERTCKKDENDVKLG